MPSACETSSCIDFSSKDQSLVLNAYFAGYWAHLLSGMGADCTAYDICEPKDMNGQPIKGWHPVKRGSPGKLKKPKHKKRCAPVSKLSYRS